MWYAHRLLMNFLLGGVTRRDRSPHRRRFQGGDSYFLVAHFHYTLGGGSSSALFARALLLVAQGLRLVPRRGLGKIGFALTFLGST